MGGMGDFKKWRGDLSNGEDDFDMGGAGVDNPFADYDIKQKYN